MLCSSFNCCICDWQSAYGEFDGCLVTPENQFAMPENHLADKIQSLIDKMMIQNQINIVGEGYASVSSSAFAFTFACFPHFCHFSLYNVGYYIFRIIGRAAFTGNHLWILSSSYNGDAYPPEV